MTRRAAAVSARRTELRLRRRRLTAGPRADVARVLGLARLACAEQLTADLGSLRVERIARIGGARPGELAGLCRGLEPALAVIGDRMDRTFAAHTGPELRRLAAGLFPGAPILPLDVPAPSGADVLRAAVGVVPARAGHTVEPRALAVLAGLPVLAAHGIGLPTALVAAGLGLMGGCLVRGRAVDRERARLIEHVSVSVAAAAAAGEREVARRLIRTESVVVAALERAVPASRDRVDAELAQLQGV